MFGLNPSDIIVRIPALLIAFAFHEWGHAVMADRFGDPTPRSQGRLTINPFVHLDIFGTLLVLVSGFGWAKPVQTNPMYYRGNKRRADLMVSLAGVLMNFLIAFIAILAVNLFWNYIFNYDALWQIIHQIIFINIAIGVFNLIPIPPLDGFHVLADLLPEDLAAGLYKLEQYGFLILMLFLITPFGGRILMPAVSLVLKFFNSASLAILSIFGVG